MSPYRTGLDSLKVEYELIRRKTNTGTPVGDEISGVYLTVDDPGVLHRFVIDNVVGSTVYFAPVITNSADEGLAPIVNQGNLYANSFNCYVPARASEIAIGYYRFVSTTQVRVYEVGSGFTGPYIYWRNGQIDSLMAEGSGRTALQCTSVNW